LRGAHRREGKNRAKGFYGKMTPNDRECNVTRVNDLEKLRKQFFFLMGALRGLAPAEGEAEKPKASERGGDFPHLPFFTGDSHLFLNLTR